MLEMVSLSSRNFPNLKYQWKLSVSILLHFLHFVIDKVLMISLIVWDRIISVLDFTEFCLLQILNFSRLLRTSWNISLLQFPYKIFNSDSDFNLYYYIQKINPTYLNFIKYGLWFMNLNIAFINLSKRNYGL